MVGSPMSLADLRRIDAGVKVTCRRCRRVRTLDREKLSEDLMSRRLSLAWELLPSQLRCTCGAKGAWVRPVPFSDAGDDVQGLVDRLVAAADRMMSAVLPRSTAAPVLLEMATAREEFEAAKRALLTWACSSRST